MHAPWSQLTWSDKADDDLERMVSLKEVDSLPHDNASPKEET